MKESEEKQFVESQADQTRRSAEDKALDRFADMMIDRIKSISEDWKKPWFTEGALSWPKNLDGRDYNGMNALMLMMHCEKEGFKLPVFLTFDRVAGLNYKGGRKTGSTQATDASGQPLPAVSVSKGSKSFPVFLTTFTVVNPDTHEKIKYDDYKRLNEEERAKYNVYPKLQVYNVFNVDQTNIAEARPELYRKLQETSNMARPEMPKEGEVFSFPAIDHMIEHNEWICSIKPKYGDDAYYSISKAEIVVPEKRQFVNGESFYANLAHEMAHSTGAENFLNRLKPSSFGSAEYAREELVAELSAALVAQRYGMTKNIKEDSCAYLKSWLENLQESPDFIKTTLTDVKKASGMIIEHVDRVALEMSRSEQSEQKQESRENQAEAPKQMEHAAKDIPTREDRKYAIYSSGVGKYVSYVSNPVVAFKDQSEALLFDDRESAKAVARECRYYVPYEKFTVREIEAPALKEAQGKLKDLGRFDIPEWSLGYMVNGDPEGLTGKEIEEADKFVQRNFPNGYIMQIDWNETNDFNQYPAFGPRNENALTIRGESPYLATKTVSVQFFDAMIRESNQDASDKMSQGEDGQKARMTDLVVELRGESRQPWLSGRVDGEQVMAEPLSQKEFKAYLSNEISVEDLGLTHFRQYLQVSPEDKMSQGLCR